MDRSCRFLMLFPFLTIDSTLPAAENKNASATPQAARTDPYGDPLPAGARARMGTVRGRHRGPVYYVAFARNAKQLVTAGQRDLVRVWETATGKELRRFGGKGDFRVMLHAPLAADGRTLVESDLHGRVRFWDVDTGKLLRRLQIPPACSGSRQSNLQG